MVKYQSKGRIAPCFCGTQKRNRRSFEENRFHWAGRLPGLVFRLRLRLAEVGLPPFRAANFLSERIGIYENAEGAFL